MSARRDEAAVRALLAERLPGYLPGWRPAVGGPATAVLSAVAELAVLVADRLDRLPERDLLAFLDLAGVMMLPPRAAGTPLVFALAPDAPVDVTLPAGTEVAVSTPPPLPGPATGHLAAGTAAVPEQVLFTTDVAVSLAHARLAATVSVVPTLDRRNVRLGGSGTPVSWFGDLEPVPHEFYLGHDTLFDLPPSGEIALQFGQTRALGAPAPERPATLRWEYLTDEGWVPFEPVVDMTRELTEDGEVLLRKVRGPVSARAAVDGIESFWIRAVVVGALPPAGADPQSGPLPRLDTVRARLTNRTSGLPADVVIADGAPADPTREFLPFGAQPAPGAAILIACDEAFRRAGATITVTLRLATASDATPAGGLRLAHEYSTGPGTWAPIPGVSADLLQGSGERTRTVAFVAPADWAQSEAPGASHRWLRMRVADGSYGAPPSFATAQNQDGSWEVRRQGGARPPLIASVTAGYAFSTRATEPQHCRTHNGFRWEDRLDAVRWGHRPFPPFEPVPDRDPAVYLGFDQPLPVGLVSVLADVDDAGAGEPVDDDPAGGLIWEYRSARGWSELAVLDGTAGFRRTGTVQFIGPPDHAPDAGPVTALRWVRGRVRAGDAVPTPRPVRGLHLNAAPATARRAVRGEPLGRGDGGPALTLTVQRPPVLTGQRVEVQEWRGTGNDWQAVAADAEAGAVSFDTGPRGEVEAIWVPWTERPHLLFSGPADRHYTLDRPSGTLRFGDGLSGRIPPAGAPIRIGYDSGGGPQGNVPAGAVNRLHSAVPYVESVTNPLATDGGAAAEDVAALTVRGPQRLRHRDRAVAAEDYEALAREASTEVALARCLPVTGRDGPGLAGAVTVVVAPASAAARPRPGRDLLALVREHLAARAPAATARVIRVVAPDYTPVSVLADAVVTTAAAAAATELAVRQALEAFLHPLTGGPVGAGWDFGATVHVSRFARMLESVPGVDHVTALQLGSGGAVLGDRVTVPPGCLPCSGPHVVRLSLEV